MNFWKETTLWKVIFWYQWIIHLIIECNKGTSCEQKTGNVNIHLYECVSLQAPEFDMCVCVCDIKYIWPRLYMLDLSKLDALLHKTHIKVLLVLKLDMCRLILSLNNTSNVVWSLIQLKKHDNRKNSGGGGWSWQGSWGAGGAGGPDNIRKRGDRQYREVFIKQGG